jgi:hypothetical protein
LNILCNADSERALILAPQGRDAQVAAGILREDKLAAELCRDLCELARKISDGAGLAVLTDDVIHDTDVKVLAGWVRSQEPWSDFPFVVLTQRGAGLEPTLLPSGKPRLSGTSSFWNAPFTRRPSSA